MQQQQPFRAQGPSSSLMLRTVFTPFYVRKFCAFYGAVREYKVLHSPLSADSQGRKIRVREPKKTLPRCCDEILAASSCVLCYLELRLLLLLFYKKLAYTNVRGWNLSRGRESRYAHFVSTQTAGLGARGYSKTEISHSYLNNDPKAFLKFNILFLMNLCAGFYMLKILNCPLQKVKTNWARLLSSETLNCNFPSLRRLHNCHFFQILYNI